MQGFASTPPDFPISMRGMAREDGFLKPTREIIARRSGYRCSNPNCRLITTGPGDDHSGTSDVGVAAHITAASKGGKRYDSNISAEFRRSAENGVWLCQVHAKLIDDAPERFPVELLKQWKSFSEEAARLEIEELEKGLPTKQAKDVEALQVYSKAFDRDAFKVSFAIETSMSSFAKAITDTIVAISTGTLRDREGRILATTIGRSEFHNRQWRAKLGIVLDLLSAIRNRFQAALADSDIVIHSPGSEFELYEIRNPQLRDWMDYTRAEILTLMNQILAESGLDPLPQSPLRQSHW